MSSYLHSLRQKARRLELAIQSTTDSSWGTLPDSRSDSEPAQEHGYHLHVNALDDLPEPSCTAYLGPGNSARLSERILKSIVRWHSVHNIPLPKCVLPDTISHMMNTLDSVTQQSFPMVYDQRKIELHTLVPPSTQRAIIEHYLKTVSPEYELLFTERGSTYLTYENPLKWSSTNRNHPAGVEISIVFAISSALVSRDIDSSVSGISVYFREDLYSLSQRAVSPEDPIETTRLICAALCALALCEFISPTSSQLWDLLGRATSTIESLREGYHIRQLNLDKSFRQLERSILKLERQVLSFCTKRFR